MNFRNLRILFVNPSFLVIVQHLYGCKLWRLTGSQEKIEKLRGAAEAPPAGGEQQHMAGGAGGRFRPFERSLSCYGFLKGRRKVRKSGVGGSNIVGVICLPLWSGIGLTDPPKSWGGGDCPPLRFRRPWFPSCRFFSSRLLMHMA